MPTFEYIALNPTGKQTRGNIVAESAVAARHLLRNRKLHTTKLHPVSDLAHRGDSRLIRLFTQGKRNRKILEFTRQLATMVQANIQLTEALAVLTLQLTDPKFNQVVQTIRDRVLAGESLADCMTDYPNWFDPIYIAMIRVGEVTGNLARSLKLLADYKSKRIRVEAKIKSALTYPAILVVVAVIVTVVLMTLVVPKLTGIILSSGKELPAPTLILMWVSDALIHYWWLILLILTGASWLFQRILATDKGHFIFDRLTLKIPVIGELIRQSIVARFTSTLAALIRSGLPMADSLKIVANVTGNRVMNQAVKLARERIMAGADIATPLRNSKLVDASVAHMISVGERTGEMEEMLLTISEGIEESTDIRIQRISSVIEPIVIVLMAVVIGFILLATLLPILQVSNIANV
ncbi:MAG: type II secretion system F family protein [Planctomycetes bacterium]|nr:type II secretion system F family protein [Planctomycetota bacterium]